MNSILGRLGIEHSNNSSLKINRYSKYINNKSFDIGFENLVLTNSINEIIDNRLIANGESFKDKAKEIGSKIIDSIIALWNKFKRLFIKLKNKFLNLKLIAKIKKALNKTSKGKKSHPITKNTASEIKIEYPVTIKMHGDLIETMKRDSKRPFEIESIEEISRYSISVENIKNYLDDLNDIYKEITKKQSYNGYIDRTNSKSIFSNNGTMNTIMDVVKNGVILQQKLDNKVKKLNDKNELKDFVVENEMQVVFIKLRLNAALKLINEKILPRIIETSKKTNIIIDRVNKLLLDVKKNKSRSK